jgi:hypothetical protein
MDEIVPDPKPPANRSNSAALAESCCRMVKARLMLIAKAFS